MSEQIPETWAELAQAIAFAIGWKLCKYEVTPDDPQWHIYKEMRAPKWYVTSPFLSEQTVYFRDTKAEALADLPRYHESLDACKDILAVVPPARYTRPDDPRKLLVIAAQYFHIELHNPQGRPDFDHWLREAFER